MKCFWIIVCTVCLQFSLTAQNFNYSFSQYQSQGYQEILSGNIIATQDSINFSSKKIPIGFTFDFDGKSFDSLQVTSNGYLIFDNNSNYSIAMFAPGLTWGGDSSSLSSVISYTTVGDGNNASLIIQFKDCGYSGYFGRFNAQIKLEKSSKIIMITFGESTYEVNSIEFLFGLINSNYLGSGIIGKFLTNNNILQTVTSPDELVYYKGLPQVGKVFSFIPLN